jgi:hypothetical protein
MQNRYRVAVAKCGINDIRAKNRYRVPACLLRHGLLGEPPEAKS